MKCRDASCELGIGWEGVGAVFALLQLIEKKRLVTDFGAFRP